MLNEAFPLTESLAQPKSEWRVVVTDTLTDELERLRRTGYVEDASVSTRDRFDEHCQHLVVYREDQPVAMVRIDLSGDGLFRSLAAEPLPEGYLDRPRASTVSRSVVSPTHRGKGLYRLLMTEALLYLATHGKDTVVSAIEEHFVGRRFLGQLGFVELAPSVRFTNPPCADKLCVCIMLPSLQRKQATIRQMNSLLKRPSHL